ncbi:MAG TPA: SPOR domain-containing protein [Rhodanobacteraceae bacterium]|nr:SPOR domain-containing protein [Rhodanobacteraceae bacterium]
MDSGLKKRLLGAVVLIALAVIFVPMLLPGSRSGSQTGSTRVPPEPSGELQTRILEVGPGGASAGSSTAAAIGDPDHVATLDLAGQPQPSAPPADTASSIEATTAPVAATASGPAASAPTQPRSAPASAAADTTPASRPVATAQSEPIPGGAGAAAGALYTVNLGIYADHASANKLVADARRHGFTALATPEVFQGKSVLRVRVGPFHGRAEAEAARLKLKGVVNVPMTVDAAVVDQSGDAPASAIAAGQPGAWAVQLAAFSDQASADKLRDRLRELGFDGYVDSVTTSKGKLWRVRAGPFASRDVAESRRGQIAQKLKIEGDIVTE